MYYDETNDIGMVATEDNKGFVVWYTSEDHSDGPVTAMTYLHNATKDWTNIPNMIMNYEDENINGETQQKGTDGYGSIVTTGTTTIITSKSEEETGRIENLKARMPRYDEVHGTGKCLLRSVNENNYGSCPLWLVNYMNTYEAYSAINGKVEISDIIGYWTLSSMPSWHDTAWFVRFVGNIENSGVRDGNFGVRPVINLKL